MLEHRPGISTVSVSRCNETLTHPRFRVVRIEGLSSIEGFICQLQIIVIEV